MVGLPALRLPQAVRHRVRADGARALPLIRRAAAVVAILLAGSGARAEDGAAPPAADRGPAGAVFLRVNERGAEEWFRVRDGAVVVRVPGGPFLRRPYEGTVASADPKPVVVASFFADRTEVTNEQFARFLTARGLATAADAADLVRAGVPGLVPPEVVGHDDTALHRPIFGPWTAQPGMERKPVTACTGRGAEEFAAWVGGRLPVPAEWEKAASGTDGRLYPWGDDAPDATRANFGRPEPRGLDDVGARPLGASPYGCVDMAGNAYERVVVERPGGGRAPVMIKGGSWASPHPLNLRVLDLCMQAAEVADRTVGFRCVMDDPAPERPVRTAPAAASVRWAADFDAAVREARERRVPVLLTLQHDTCGQCDRTRAQLFRDPRFVAYVNERMVCVAGHVAGDALDDPHPPRADGACPLYAGVTCAQHETLYSRGLQVVGTFRVTPGNFVLDPDHAVAGAGAAAVLVPERELAKWGNDVQGALDAFERARAELAARAARPGDAR